MTMPADPRLYVLRARAAAKLERIKTRTARETSRKGRAGTSAATASR